MKIGSLFSGAGLGDLGWMMAGHDIRWQCEIDSYCQKLLSLRFPESKKYYDIGETNAEEVEKVDIITAGVPCQPASNAGNKRGRKDDRWLWPKTIAFIRIVKPKWVVFENVSGLISLEQGMALEYILSEVESIGYECESFIFPAHALGANILRAIAMGNPGKKLLEKDAFEKITEILHKYKRIDSMRKTIKMMKKWPTLSELHMKIFNMGFKAHSSKEDVEATKRCYDWLLRKGIVPTWDQLQEAAAKKEAERENENNL